MKQRLFQIASPSLAELSSNVRVAVRDNSRGPLIRATAPAYIVNLPEVVIVGDKAETVQSPASPTAPNLPSLPKLSTTVARIKAGLDDQDSPLSLTLQAATAVEPNFTYLLLPIIARESGGNPTAVNPSSSATGLMQLLKSSAARASVIFGSQAFAKVRQRLGPILTTLRPSLPLVASESAWRPGVLDDPESQVLPNAVWYHAMLKDVVGKGLVKYEGGVVVFSPSLPAQDLTRWTSAHPILKTNYKAALQFIASLWWIEGGPKLLKGGWTHASHALKDVNTLLALNKHFS